MRASAVNRWKGNTAHIAWQLDSESSCRTDVHWCHRKWRCSLWEVTAISCASCQSGMSEGNSSVSVMLSTLTAFSNTLHHNAPKEDHTHNRNHKLGCSGDISCCECVTGRPMVNNSRGPYWYLNTPGLQQSGRSQVWPAEGEVEVDESDWTLPLYLSTSTYAQLIGIVWLN